MRAAPMEVVAGAALAVVAATMVVARARGTAVSGRRLLVFSTAVVVAGGTLTTMHLLW
ncbi:hypothetical protein ILP97_00805 [Amycolatopsis sp. H6(2020)]|nr:hypothetical protein [Amycolatopsis sp. H6(2020)]